MNCCWETKFGCGEKYFKKNSKNMIRTLNVKVEWKLTRRAGKSKDRKKKKAKVEARESKAMTSRKKTSFSRRWKHISGRNWNPKDCDQRIKRERGEKDPHHKARMRPKKTMRSIEIGPQKATPEDAGACFETSARTTYSQNAKIPAREVMDRSAAATVTSVFFN
jgi:hypothetical protein